MNLDLTPIKERLADRTQGAWAAEFIASAPTDIAALVEEVERLRERETLLKGHVSTLAAKFVKAMVLSGPDPEYAEIAVSAARSALTHSDD